ncbi:MAG: histidinol phosphate phosphatase, partial [Christensenella hongkongensis]|nr:histidinol phosphate phosphatase [Christensenella hongkongensis]
PSIIKRFAELGGEVMTMGSDAHFSDAIGHRFRDAVQLMKQCGVKYVCTFEQRKPSFIPLEEL